MGLMKLCLFFFFVAAATAVPGSSAFPESTNDWARAYGAPDFAFFGGLTPIDAAKDSGRLLFQYGYNKKYSRKKYLSYDALKKNNIPCGRRGSSYYDCTKRKRANPYRRSCTAITGCARFIN